VAEPWIKRDTGDGPSTHALVIGVSAYEHLPDGAAPPAVPAEESFGLKQLESAASSAWSFAQWLRDEYNPPQAPLGTVRLFLSPSAKEDVQAGIPAATTAAVQPALMAWFKAFKDRPDDVAILYAAGHGIMLSKDEGAIVLLEDFGAPDRGVIQNSLDVPTVIKGLAGEKIAQSQFFFIDACSVKPDLVKDMESMQKGVGLDVPGHNPPSVAAIYASAAPDTLALGAPGKGTLFSQALVECLDGLAATLDDGGGWVIKDTSMVGPLKDRITDLAAEHDAEQVPTSGGTLGSTVLHMLPEPPRLEVEFRVAPDEATPFCFATLDDEQGKTIVKRSPLDPAPLQKTIPAGIYLLAVAIDPAEDNRFKARQQPCFLRPPKPPPVVVKVS
jgi:Caspase domain